MQTRVTEVVQQFEEASGNGWRRWVLRQGAMVSWLQEDGGGGLSRDEILLTRWHPDRAVLDTGHFLYVRDLETGRFWSVGLRPSMRLPDHYAILEEGGVWHLFREDEGVALHLQVWLADDLEAEIRQLRLVNRSGRSRNLEITSYAEVALAPPHIDLAHPVFSKLFLQTDVLPPSGLIAWRRPSVPEEEARYLYQYLLGGEQVAWETDRLQFVGRGGTLQSPRALIERDTSLSGSVGSVLEPILSLRTTICLGPGSAVCLWFVTGCSEKRKEVLSLGRHFEKLFRAQHRKSQYPQIAVPSDRSFGENHDAARYRRASASDVLPLPEVPLSHFNGWGGFSEEGTAYVIRLQPKSSGRLRLPPGPWANVVANEKAGFVVTERGGGYTWVGNSRTNRLTPYYGDPVTDTCGEALYLRDEDARTYWSPLPGPAPAPAPYEVSHGMGYTRFWHGSQGLLQEACCFVPRDLPLKIIQLRLRNAQKTRRRISLFYFARWVLGELPIDRSAIRTRWRPDLCAMLAENPSRGLPYTHRVAFAALVAPKANRVTATGEGENFIGGHGSLEAPEAVVRGNWLEERVGIARDPCAAIQASMTLEPGEETECLILLGEADTDEEAVVFIRDFQQKGRAEQALEEVQAFWQKLCGRLQVQTPHPELDLMANGWLLYQTVSCRLWGRSAYYQPGGAYGFRDQLQDAAALVYVWPGRTRQQLLLHAAHQFVEGDVLHWWHPEGVGPRTRFSDDRLWLPYLTLHYLRVTGDERILEEKVPFLEGPALEEGEVERLIRPEAGPTDTFLEHCLRAIDRSLETGPHGLPLIGCGDWNDGLSRVGVGGKGESVWLGFFLGDILAGFIPLCERLGLQERASRYRAHFLKLQKALEAAGWDGAWYRRAYFDDGTPLGARDGEACRVDVLVQAWSVLSGAGRADRARKAIEAALQYLVDPEARLIRLLTPPFDGLRPHPGYIQGYVPGVRENGAQYTHAALWFIKALAESGRLDLAAEMLCWISPVARTRSLDEVERYGVEPYVVAADIYGVQPHVGRGGWTWYTGSAGWMYRVLLESIIGFGLESGQWLRLRLSWPASWPGYQIRYREPKTEILYLIEARRDEKETGAWLDGKPVVSKDGYAYVPLLQDGGEHHVLLKGGKGATS